MFVYANISQSLPSSNGAVVIYSCVQWLHDFLFPVWGLGLFSLPNLFSHCRPRTSFRVGSEEIFPGCKSCLWRHPNQWNQWPRLGQTKNYEILSALPHEFQGLKYFCCFFGPLSGTWIRIGTVRYLNWCSYELQASQVTVLPTIP